MTRRVMPMIHVPDVAAMVDWYKGIGFTVLDTYCHDGEGISFAIISFGNTEVMFNEGSALTLQRFYYRRLRNRYLKLVLRRDRFGSVGGI